MEEKELTREERLEIEEKAIQALVNMGVKFSVQLNINPVNPPKYIQWWNKHFPNRVKVWRDKRLPKDWDVEAVEMPNAALQKMERVYVRNFHIKPLFLGTIDCLRRLYLNIEYDEERIQEEPLQESKKLFKYIPIMAEIAAVAIINNPTVAESAKSKEVQKLKKFLMEHLTVSRLQRLADVVSQMMNPGGFYFLYSVNTGDRNDPAQSKPSRVIGLNSPWGSRGEIIKNFGWTYDYLLWGISWMNVQVMMADSARIDDTESNQGDDDSPPPVELKSKDDIKNFLKVMM